MLIITNSRFGTKPMVSSPSIYKYHFIRFVSKAMPKRSVIDTPYSVGY
jgi:hypothetical protein